MVRLNRALIIGGGIAGMCAAIQLRTLDIAVDLVEIDPAWRPEGAGITLSGPTLRAFTEVGVIDAIIEHGWCADGVDIYTASGHKVDELPTRRLGRPDVPGAGGILRPVLCEILKAATLNSGTQVHRGMSVRSLHDSGQDVTVEFSDGARQRYDLVVGADGLQSQTRTTLFPSSHSPRYTGQGSWRAVVPRPSAVQRGAMFIGAKTKAGVNPVSRHEMYLFVTEPRDKPDHLDQSVLPGMLRSLLTEFGGLVGEIRDALNTESRIVFRPFWALLLPLPWHRGRTVLIGDAVHATTPHLASGAGIGVEDAVVLAQSISAAEDCDSALSAFGTRRFERCRTVVENSLQLGDIERTGGSKQLHQQLMRDSMIQLQGEY